MIKEKFVTIKIGTKTLKYYKDKGYDVKSNEISTIKVEDLTKGSKTIITAICKICDHEKKITYKEYNRNTSKYNFYTCSNKCAQIKNQLTSIEKYGKIHYSKTIEFKEQMIQTNNERYNVDFFTQSNLYNEKMKKYWETHDFNNENKKRIETNKIKFDAEYYQQSQQYIENKKSIIENYKSTINLKLLNKYSHLNIISTDNNLHIFHCTNCKSNFEISRELLKNRLKGQVELCTNCNVCGSSKSGLELQLYKFIKENYDGIIQTNKRKILDNKLELDIYLPELKLAFEFNGLYWHSNLKKDKNYHINKTNKCLEKNINLIHIWEDDWKYKQNIIKSMILNRLGKLKQIDSKECEIKEIKDISIVKDFLNENHLEGFIKSSIKLGLYYNSDLMSMMLFKKIKDSYKLIYCNKLNINIINGENMLINYFKKLYISDLIVYINIDWNQYIQYEKIGFKFEKQTKPTYSFIINDKRSNKNNTNKKYNIIYNTGNMVYNLIS